MANSQQFDCMAIGKHCAEITCRQLDFLPFTCEFCKKSYCGNHRKPKEHLCEDVINRDSMLPRCPLCEKYLAKGGLTENDNDQIEKHIISGCQILIATKRKKQRCSQNRCKQITIIPFNCSNCYGNFCVKHRHPGDHNCHQETHSVLVMAR